eukprot:3593500-Ditylum_brightwellii.AAC.1
MDNAANVHIFNDKRILVGELIPIESNVGVATTGGTDHKPTAIGTARINQTIMKVLMSQQKGNTLSSFGTRQKAN